MQKLLRQLTLYECANEQEQEDRQVMIECIGVFPNLFTRENKVTHFVTMAVVLNETMDKVLMVYHNIFSDWTLPGGHADGDVDLLRVAEKEVMEETGIKHLTPISEKIFSVDILPVMGHMKKGQYVSAHTHLTVSYLFTANERETVRVKPDENSEVRWMPLSEIECAVKEEHMKNIYLKMIEKLKQGC